MKCSVSKMLPNSFSKWFSPKMDLNNSRRRRHDELDSEDDDTERNRSPIVVSHSSTQIESRNNNDLVRMATAPPNKKLKLNTVIASNLFINFYHLDGFGLIFCLSFKFLIAHSKHIQFRITSQFTFNTT